MTISPERSAKVRRAASLRQPDLTVVIENVHDTHNIGAIMRTCDSVGIGEIFVLYTDDRLTEKKFKVGAGTSSGANRWVDVHFFNDVDACFDAVRKKYKHIFATHLSEEAKSLYELDLKNDTALVFGNEHAGISEKTLKHTTGNFVIPMMGMTQSLNISVACAVSLYEACRQRLEKNRYSGRDKELTDRYFDDYSKRHLKNYTKY